MINASHNSWSYAKPKYWYMWPFRFMCRCQKKDIQNQYNSGVRLFDLRLFFDKKGAVLIRHGILSFNISYSTLMLHLETLNAKKEKIYVRVILEQNHKVSNQGHQDKHFKEFCEMLEKTFPNISFIEGTRKYNREKLYNFNTEIPKIIHKYSSHTALFGEDKTKWYAKLDDWWPWLYAHLHNADSVGKYIDEEGYLMLDYI